MQLTGEQPPAMAQPQQQQQQQQQQLPPMASCMFAADGGGTDPWVAQIPPPPPAQQQQQQQQQPAGAEREPRPGSCYRHVPHRDKPPQLVARRNARERRRVQAVNSAFSRLRRAVPIDNARGKRVSKVKTLHKAIEYIEQLQRLLVQAGPPPAVSGSPDRNKENSGEVNSRWDDYEPVCRPQNCGPDSLAQFLSEFQDF